MEGLNSLDEHVLRFNRDDVRALMRHNRMLNELMAKHGKKEVQSDLLSSIKTDNQAEKKRLAAEMALEERAALFKELHLATAQDGGRGIDCSVSEEELQQGLQFYLETPVSPRQLSNVSSASTWAHPYEFRPVTSFFSDSTSTAFASRETSPLLRASELRRGVRFFSPDASAATSRETSPYLDTINAILLEAPTVVIQLAELGPVKMDEFERKHWRNFLLARAPSDDIDSQETVGATGAYQVLPDDAEEEANSSVCDEDIFNIELPPESRQPEPSR